MREYNFINDLAIYQKIQKLKKKKKIKILWHFKMFVNKGPYSAGDFKTLLLRLIVE